MGRYLDIIRGREMALHKQCADLDGQGSAEIQESESRHERNEKDELIGNYPELPPDELALLDLRLRIIAPDNTTHWTIDDWLEWIAERSAILEFDAEYTREQADAEAFLLWRMYRQSVDEGPS